MIATIYLLTNTTNQKKYVGFTTNYPLRMLAYQRNGRKARRPIEHAIAKYGWESFTHEEIYLSKDKNHTLSEMEPYFIGIFDAVANGYNIVPGGRGNGGYVFTPEAKKNVSQGVRASWTPERRKAAAERVKKQWSEERKAKHSTAMTGRTGNGPAIIGKNYKSIKVMIDGIQYPSLCQAKKALGISFKRIKELASTD